MCNRTMPWIGACLLLMVAPAMSHGQEAIASFALADDAAFAAPGWSAPQKDGERTFRAYAGKGAAAKAMTKVWWQGTDPKEDVCLRIVFKDAGGPLTVSSYSGPAPSSIHFAGLIGGRGDGQWTEGLVVLSREVIGARDGQHVIQFSGEDATPVERIDIVKATDELRSKAVTRARAIRAAEIEKLKTKFELVPWKETVVLGDVAPQHKAAGFLPFARRYTQDVYPGTIPTEAERKSLDLRAYATPGEIETIQAAALALEDVTIEAVITDLKGPGALAAGTQVLVHRIEAAPVRVGASASKKWQMQPVWLRNNEPVAVAKGTSQAWYITVRVPADAKSGEYRGVFTLKTARAPGAQAEFPVVFRVLPFALDKADHVARGAYCSGPVSDEHVRGLAEHGVNSMSMWQGSLPPALVDGNCTASPTDELDRYLRSLKKHGFVRMVYFGGGDKRFDNPAGVAGATKSTVGSPEFEKYYGQYWNAIRRLEKERSWPEMICCPFDEPVKSDQKVKNYLTCYNIIKKSVPDTQVFCVFMNRDWAVGRLGKESDIWSCNGAFPTAAAQKKALAETGVKRLFYTYCMGVTSTRPGTVRYNSGFFPWRFDADGTYFWAYVWHAADPFNDLDGPYTDWTTAARDVDGVLYDTVGFEGWREGVDDRRYVETALRLAREKKRADVLAKIEELRKKVESGQESDVSTQTQGLDTFFFKIDNASVLDAYRAQVVQLILDMLEIK